MDVTIKFLDGSNFFWKQGQNTPTCDSSELLVDCLSRLDLLGDFLTSSGLDSAGVSDELVQLCLKLFWLFVYWFVLHLFYSILPG